MVPDQPGIRPTKAVVVKALCDILQPVIRGLVVLDLFAGTGRVSRRLLAAGASRAYAVDLNECPEENPAEVTWIRADAKDYLNCSSPPEDIDLIYLDPPYKSSYLEEVLADVVNCNRLNKQAIIAVENSISRAPHPLEFRAANDRRFCLMREREYGITRLSIYQGNRARPAVERSELRHEN